MHEPLSENLKRVLQSGPAFDGVSLGELLERTGGRGMYLFILILCLPFVLPVSVPGMSTPLGLAIIALAAGFLRGHPPNLPHKLAQRKLSPKVRSVLLRGGVRFLRFLERGVRPRRTFWMSWRAVVLANTSLLIFMAVLLALPLPPVPPFTNMLPSYAIIFLALSMMEEDGVLIFAAYGLSAGTTFYFAWWAKEIIEHFVKWGHALLG